MHRRLSALLRRSRTADRSGLESDNPLIGLARRFYPPNSGNRKPDYYLDFYHQALRERRLEHLSLLEIGVAEGASLLMWREYFPHARIVGLDMAAPPPLIRSLPDQNRIAYVQGDQSDAAALARAVSLAGKSGFDIIIDDAAHVGASAKASFNYLFSAGLTAGGLYFIEDLGTAYFSNWSDSGTFSDPADAVEQSGAVTRFPSHDHGMIGFVKQLIDELHYGTDFREHEGQRYPIAFLTLIPSVAMLGKAPAKHARQ